jgi:hypothetical protein
MEEIRRRVFDNLTGKVSSLGIRETSMGEVVVVHGDSLLIDSVWLDRDKAPILWINKNELANARTVDPKASVRFYFATQILFPQYMTAATFFVRLFWAGNSASCQIAVTTLGPPAVDPNYFRERLLKHAREVKESDGKVAPITNGLNEDESEAIGSLMWVRSLSQQTRLFRSHYLDLDRIKKLEISSEKTAKSKEYESEHRKIVEASAVWPGLYCKWYPNWRENNSYTFTTDFFGRSEAVASVRTLYDQISRSMLDTLDTLGFDISDYRDKDGKYSINAEKIEQLVVGETIQIDGSKKSRDSEADHSK